MNINIRTESKYDKDLIYNIIEEAFRTAEHSDGDEQNLVNRLRESKSFIQSLSLVAEIDNNIVGHILFTKCYIVEGKERKESLALAPLSVLPKYQNVGVGTKLINEGIKMAKELGYSSIIVLGSEKYYPKFGFCEAKEFNIKAPFDVPSENFMVIELRKGALSNISGTVEYAKEFFA